jgi:quercetin 2,3-dioxygenase
MPTAAAAFKFHSARDIPYVLEGALEHKDSLGNGSVIRPGEVQRMSAGRGITHSEFNPSSVEAVHFLQIWILPDRRGIAPSYEQQAIDLATAHGRCQPIASRQGGTGIVRLNQDAGISIALLEAGERLVHHLGSGRHAWLQVARGAIALNSVKLSAGDGAAISEEAALKIGAEDKAEILLFDLA